MIYRKDNLFDRFVCIADKCPESCCTLWQIVIDEESLTRYGIQAGQEEPLQDAVSYGENVRAASEELAEYLQNGIDWEDGSFKQCNRRCAMLRDDNLCRIQAEQGHEALSVTCRTYPRHTEEFEDEREYTLSLSCPEAARMILSEEDPLHLVEWEDDLVDESFEDGEFDFLMYSKLLDARDILLSIAQNRKCSLTGRMDAILELGRQLQMAWDDGNLDAFDKILEEEKTSFGRASDEGNTCSERNHFSFLFELETLHEDWTEDLNAAWKKTDWTNPLSADHQKTEQTKHLEFPKAEEIAGEQILVSLLFTYFLGAVYDDMIYSKVALCIYSVRWIFILAMAEDAWKNPKERKQILIRTTYRYCREVEHSDLNLNALEEHFDETMPK